jgi:hypothetical protein
MDANGVNQDLGTPTEQSGPKASPPFIAGAGHGDTLRIMDKEKQFTVINLDELQWPPALQLSSPRFRLLVAAHAEEVSAQIISRRAS